MTTLADIDEEIARALLDTIPSYTDYAGTLVLPDGKRKGGTMDAHPAQQLILQVLDSGCRHIIIGKPVQDGATTIAMAPLFRRAIVEHQTVLLCYPTGDSAKDIWTTKIAPMLLAFGGQEISTGGGSKGGAARVITLPGGGRFMLRSGGGRGESGQASVSGDAEMIDEYDDWEDMRTILNVRKRIKESPDPLLVEVSTVKRDENSLILQAYDGGTRTHLEYPCHHCAALQPLVWENVDLPTAQYRCAHCSQLWSEAQRRESLRHWKRVDEVPLATAFSIKWTCLDSPLTSMREEIHGTIALPGFLSAQRKIDLFNDHSEMRSFYRDRLCRVYTADLQDEEGGDDKLCTKVLSDRSNAHGWAAPVVDLHPDKLWSRYVTEIPSAADALVVAVDVQGDRIYWAASAFRYLGQTWDVAWGQERCRMRQVGNTLEPEPWGPGDLIQTMDRVAEFVSTITDLPILHRVVDTRYETRELALWLGRNREWRGVIGHKTLPKIDPESDQDKQVMMLPNLLSYDRQWMPRIGRFQVVTEGARAIVHSGLRKSPTEPGAILLPRGLPSSDHYLRHLCSWLLVTDPDTKKTKWERQQKRDDHLDCRSYIEALIRYQNERRLKLTMQGKTAASSVDMTQRNADLAQQFITTQPPQRFS